jgi:hypothetical protein
VLGDVDQLIYRLRLVSLRVDEDQLLPHLFVLRAVVDARQVGEGRSRLACPEQGLLAHLDRLLLVLRQIEQPAPVVRVTHLAEGEDHLLLQVVGGDPRVESAQEGRVLGGVPLAEPEDRLFARVIRGAGFLGEVAQDLAGAVAADLGQGEQRLLLDLLVGRGLEDRVERGHGFLAPHLREPEHRLLAHFLIGIAARGAEQDVFGFRGALLRNDEDGLAPQLHAATVAARQDLFQDRHGGLSVHLQ